MSTDHKHHVAEWKLERALLNELPAHVGQLGQRLENPKEQERLAELKASNRKILEFYPAHAVATEVHRRARIQAKPAKKRRWVFPSLATAAAVGCAVLALTSLQNSEENTERTKGLRPGLVIHRKQSDRAERLGSGALVHTGEQLQIGIVSAGKPYAVVVSLDGRGQVTSHFPDSTHATALKLSGETLLPFAYALDDAPEFESFYLVTSLQPIDHSQVETAARALGQKISANKVTREAIGTERLDLPSELSQSIFWVKKVGSSENPTSPAVQP